MLSNKLQQDGIKMSQPLKSVHVATRRQYEVYAASFVAHWNFSYICTPEEKADIQAYVRNRPSLIFPNGYDDWSVEEKNTFLKEASEYYRHRENIFFVVKK